LKSRRQTKIVARRSNGQLNYLLSDEGVDGISRGMFPIVRYPFSDPVLVELPGFDHRFRIVGVGRPQVQVMRRSGYGHRAYRLRYVLQNAAARPRVQQTVAAINKKTHDQWLGFAGPWSEQVLGDILLPSTKFVFR